MEALAYQVPVGASLQDPMLNATVQPEPVQTAAGQQELILSASQKFHWFGKLDMRASVAESQTGVARAHLAACIFETVPTPYQMDSMCCQSDDTKATSGISHGAASIA